MDQIPQQETPKKKIATYVYVLWIAGILLLPALMLSDIKGDGHPSPLLFLISMGDVAVYFIYGYIAYAFATRILHKSKGFLRYLTLTTFITVAITGFRLNQIPKEVDAKPKVPTTAEWTKLIEDSCKARYERIGSDTATTEKVCDCYVEKVRNNFKYEELSSQRLKDSAKVYIQDCIKAYAELK